MENLIHTSFNAVRNKGFIECVIGVICLVASAVYSLAAVIVLRVRGYDVAYSTHIHPTGILFQSKFHAIKIGAASDVRRNTRISAGFDGSINIGRQVLVDEGTCIMAQRHIAIGDNTLIAPYCFITDFNHRFDSKLMLIAKQGYETKPVIIEDDVWIGTHSVILPGVRIGKGSVVGAGSVVTKSIKPYSVVVGNPARVVKTRS